MDNFTWSYVFSVLSLIFYSIVYFPQFYLIYKTKNSEDLSIMMLILWSQADALSLVGVILLQLELNLVIIGWYHMFVGILMMSYTFYYRKKYTILESSSIFLFISTNIALCSVLQSTVTQPYEKPGEIIGWFTTGLYIIGRFPQIYFNFKTRSVEGLSIMMYVYTILGNLLYIMSIIFFSTDFSYIKLNMPWIVLGVVTIVLDLFLIAQCKYYKKYPLLQATPAFIVDF